MAFMFGGRSNGVRVQIRQFNRSPDRSPQARAYRESCAPFACTFYCAVCVVWQRRTGPALRRSLRRVRHYPPRDLHGQQSQRLCSDLKALLERLTTAPRQILGVCGAAPGLASQPLLAMSLPMAQDQQSRLLFKWRERQFQQMQALWVRTPLVNSYPLLPVVEPR